MNRLAMNILAAAVLATAPAAAPVSAPWQAGRAAPQMERIPVQVTAVSAGSVFLDVGRAAGLEPGDTVRLLPLGGSAVLATVRVVSRTSARAELENGEGTVEIGTEGEVLVPRERLRRPTNDPPAKTQGEENRKPPGEEVPPAEGGTAEDDEETPPAHPAWEHPPVEWDEDTPLLAPIENRTPAERDPRVRGRVHTQLHTTSDRQGGGRDYLLWRSGVDLTFDNPFHRGGALDLDMEVSHRAADVDDGDDESDTIFRADRLSYRRGGVRGQPRRWELGRFLQNEFPGFGVIDGVEYGHRFSSGSRLGASLGFLPSRDDEMTTGDDLQAALFYRHVVDEEQTLSLGAGLQKTWHDGESDRDLVVGEFDYRPNRNLSAHATAWVDYYTSGDKAKRDGFELTQLLFNGNYRFESGHGIGIFATRIRWPELLRNGYDDLTQTQLADNEVTRLGLRGWRRLSKRVRLDGRLGSWNDQDDSGGDASLRLGLRDLLYDRGNVSLDVHQQTGKYSSGLGFRVRADRRFDRGTLSVGWDSTNFEQEGASGPHEELVHHTLRASYDWSFGDRWALSLYVEDRLGDEQDSLSFGFFLQKRL